MSKVKHLLLDTGCSLRHFQKLDPPIWHLFCRTFTVTTVYKKWLPTQISCEFKILDNLGATMSKIKITSYQGKFFLFYSQNSRYNCVILGPISHFSIYYTFCYINEYWGLSLRALYPSMIKCCADNFKKVAPSLTLSPQDPAIYLQNCARSLLVDSVYYFFSCRKYR